MPPLEELRAWLRIARNDLSTARLALPAGLFEPVGFHCQQTIEKLLKAWLVAQGAQPPYTHDLALLFELCARCAAPFIQYRDEWEWITGFAVTSRYPTEAPLSDAAEATRALRAAEQCWDIVTTLLPKEALP